MVYGTIPKIRELAGIRAVFDHKVSIGIGDGTEKVFKLPAVGNRQGYLVDKDATGTSTITTDDVIVYVNGSSVTVSSIDQDAGEVTLTVAPLTDDVVTADYVFSEVSDDNIILAMNIADQMVDYLIVGNNSAPVTWTQTEDGDGKTLEYEVDFTDVTTITSVTVDGSILVEDTSYWIYNRPKTSFVWYIKLNSYPLNDKKNVVIVYNHGYNSDVMITRLAELYAARYILLEVKPSRTSGQWVKGEGKRTTKGAESRITGILENILNLQTVLDKRIKYMSA